MGLKEKLDEISNNSFDIFLEEFKTCLDKFAPLREKIRFNNSIFMTKSLRKAIMLRSQLKKKFNNNKSELCSIELLSFVRSYLTNRIQICKIDNHFSNWHEITTGVLQGSIFAPLFFNIFINDIFLFVESSNVCKYADDNTLFAFGKTFDEVTRNFKMIS